MTAPATTPDLLGMRLTHRIMRRDLHRLAATAGRLAGGRSCDTRRAKALVRWVTTLADEIHHHHTVEDELTWPLIERHAGTAVDLTVLSDDHRALDPLLDDLRRAAAGFLDAPIHPERAAVLADALGRVRDELDEHIENEEAELFPVIERYVPAAEWQEMEKAIRRGGPPAGFVLPRMAEVAAPGELAALKAEAGPVLVLLLGLLRPRHARRVRPVFGTS
ncbi:hemerythrin domain-containing protein [Pseudonocardia sp. RS010]|uniref:hemerythrin domain-containing protein n=1 Tax=Pseudonocardia sp. RS010 TaxID=3385979 RepID=UPI0039A348FA